MSNDTITFAPEQTNTSTSSQKDVYSILIVDDEEGVHALTKLALQDVTIEDKVLQFHSAYSAKEAIAFVREHQDVAIVLLDIVMESNDAGFKVIEEVRDAQRNQLTRIIIRTGQPGQAPERYVIEHYDINEYKEKVELTSDRLYISIRTALKQFEQLRTLNEQNSTLIKSMYTDTLTQLPNRLALLQTLKAAQNSWLLLLDIDNFSIYNSAYGFDVGDEILKHYAQLLAQYISSKSHLFRLEADRFVLLTQTSKEILHYATELKAYISTQSFIMHDFDLTLHITIGISSTNSNNALQQAEIALQEAREQNNSRIVIHSDSLHIIQNINDNFYWTRAIREALKSDNILVYYQPIVNTQTLAIEKYESLVRLRQGENIISPHYFLNSARVAGLLNDITHRVITLACQEFSNTTQKFSINITDHDLHDTAFIDFLESTREKNSLSRSQIILEVLEESSINKDSAAQQALFELLSLGYTISIDDFGVECSNFAQIGALQLESIKIDGSYIKDIVNDENAMIITQTILYLANRLKIPTVAEYVHSKEVFECIKTLNIPYAQGYYLAEPTLTPTPLITLP